MLCCYCLILGFSVYLFSSVFHSPSLPLSMSVRWFMALFKRRPHVSPDAAICFNPASFFHSPHSEANEEPTKINPWFTLARQSVFCGSSHGCACFRETWRGFTRTPLTKCWADPAHFRCWEHATDVEKWHATRMPLIMFRGKVGKMADVTRPSYQPNFIRGIHVWPGKSGYFFPAPLYCKQPLHAEVYRPALAVSGYEFQPQPFFYISAFHKHFDIIARSDMLSLRQHLSSNCTVIHCIFLMRLFLIFPLWHWKLVLIDLAAN